MGKRIQVVESEFGLINVTWPEKGLINPDGTLNRYRSRRNAWKRKEHRADATRETMWLGKNIENAPAAPFLLGRTKYDLNKINWAYFDNLTDIIKDHHEFGVKFIYTGFDFCGVKEPERAKVNPWTNNKQNTKGFHKKLAEPYVREYWENVVDCEPDLIYICNEPDYGYGNFIIFSYECLVDLGYPVRNIITGCQHVGGTEMSRDRKKLSHPYWVWKQYRKKHGGDVLKKNIMLSKHGFRTGDHIYRGLSDGGYGSRRLFLSRDGVYPRPDKNMNRNLLKYLLRKDNRERMVAPFLNTNEWYIEAICNEAHGGQGNEGEGFADAVGIKYKKYPEPIEPKPIIVVPEIPEPDPKPTPEPKPPPMDPVWLEEPEEESLLDWFKDWFKEFDWKNLNKNWGIYAVVLFLILVFFYSICG
jgi:hypothetical protein